MNHVDFVRYHNRHISFILDPTGEKKQGVLLDIIPYDKKESETEYIFVASNELKAWQMADKLRDEEQKKLLQETIDIKDIKGVEFL